MRLGHCWRGVGVLRDDGGKLRLDSKLAKYSCGSCPGSATNGAEPEQHQQCCMLECCSLDGAFCSRLPREIATIRVPVDEQKLPQSNCSVGDWLLDLAIAPDIGMASMLNSTAKQAIQANASRCRDMVTSGYGVIRRRI